MASRHELLSPPPVQVILLSPWVHHLRELFSGASGLFNLCVHHLPQIP